MPPRREVFTALALAAFLVAGQFLCCLRNTAWLWPFNPILVYVGNAGPQTRGALLLTYSATEEANPIELGWCQELVGRKLASGLMVLHKENRPVGKALSDLGRFFAPKGRGRFEWLRLYRVVWDLPQGKILEKERVAECRWP